MDHKERTLSAIALTLLVLFFAGLTLRWLHLHQAPPSWDDSWYLTNSLVLYDALIERGIAGFVREFFRVLGFKAPLIVALPVPFYLLFGRDWHVAFLVNIGSMVLLFLAVYSIARRLASRNAGLLAVIVTATMPLLYGLATWYLVEYTLTALVAAAFWLVLVSRDFENKLATFAIGVVCGLGLLLKASFPLFVAVPIGLAIYRSKLRNIALFLVPCIVLPLPWYLIHWRATLNNAIDAAYGDVPTRAVGTGAIFSINALAGYLKIVMTDGVSTYYTIAGAAVLLPMMLRRDRRIIEILLWAAPFAVFLFAGNKDIRYTAPLYPIFAIALGIAMDALLAHRQWIGYLALIFPILSMLSTTTGWPYEGADHRYARRYAPSAWHQDAIIRLIAGRVAKPVRVLIATDRERFNANNFELSARQQRLPLAFLTTAYESNLDGAIRTADFASFVLFKDEGEPESTVYNQHFKAVVDHVRGSSVEVPLSRELSELPDGGRARLYQISRSPVLAKDVPPLPEVHASFDDFLELTGASIHRSPDAMEVTFGWRCLKPVNREYWCFTHVVDERNRIVAQMDHLLANGTPPIVEWKAGDGAMETLRRPVPATAGKLRIRLGLYHVPTDQRLRLTLPMHSKATLTDDGTALFLEP